MPRNKKQRLMRESKTETVAIPVREAANEFLKKMFEKGVLLKDSKADAYIYNHDIIKGSLDTCELLYDAVEAGCTTAVEIFLKNGLDVNSSRDNISALSAAVINENATMIKLLLEYGAGALKHTGQIKGPLHFAVLGYHTDAIEILLRHGVNVNAVDEHGKTALHYACENLDEGIGDCCHAHPWTSPSSAELLLKAGPYVNLQDEAGWTALHYVCKRLPHCYSEECGIGYGLVRHLLDAGADISIETKEGKTPYQISGRYNLRAAGRMGGVEQPTPEIGDLMLKYDAIGLHVNQKDLQNYKEYFPEEEDWDDYYDKYDNYPTHRLDEYEKELKCELAMMKSHRISDGFTLYDFLTTKNLSYRSNDTLLKTLEAFDYAYSKKFSEYFRLIKRKIKTDERRYKLNAKAMKCFLGLRPQSADVSLQTLPKEMIEKIFSHLNIADLENLLVSCENLGK